MKRNCRGIAGKSHNDASETVCLFQSSAGRRSCYFWKHIQTKQPK
uniref:Uncharacterized protein n=1 Tax=Anguilla anguilla TaxID=7936 RepID=A0A0E9TZM6_ANGAN